MWIYLPKNQYIPASHCLPASEDSISDSMPDLSTLASTLSPSVMSKSEFKTVKFWQRELKKGASHPLLSGVISRHSAGIKSTGKLSGLSADFHAQIFRSPVPARAWTILDPVCGASMLASFANFNPAESSSRTSGLSSTLFAMEEESLPTRRPVTYSETWPISGSMRNGVCFQRKRLALRTPANDGSALLGGGVWPSARAEDSESCGNHPGAVDSLTGATSNWATPKTITGGAESAERKQELGRLESGGGDLQAQTANWNTPSTKDHVTDGPKVATRYGTPDMLRTDQRLRNQASKWQTPLTDSFHSRGGDRVDEMGLDQQARSFEENWPTPSVPNGGRTTNTTNTREDGSKRQIDLAALSQSWPTPVEKPQSHSSPLDQPATIGRNCWCGILNCDLRSHKRRLNVLFVENLMGWPQGWTSKTVRTDCARAAMVLWRRRLAARLSHLLSVLD